MEQNYEKYKERLSKHTLLSAIAGGIVALGAILLLFLPIFRIDLGLGIYIDFSLFDEFQIAIKKITSNAASNVLEYVDYFEILILGMSIISLLTGIIMIAFDAFKKLSKLQNSDKATMETYDTIVHRGSDALVKKLTKRGAFPHIISGIITIIFYVVYARYVIAMISELDVYVVNQGSLFSKMAYLTGVSAFCFVVLVILATGFIINLIANRIYKSVESDIIKDDYTSQKEKANNI